MERYCKSYFSFRERIRCTRPGTDERMVVKGGNRKRTPGTVNDRGNIPSIKGVSLGIPNNEVR